MDLEFKDLNDLSVICLSLCFNCLYNLYGVSIDNLQFSFTELEGGGIKTFRHPYNIMNQNNDKV